MLSDTPKTRNPTAPSTTRLNAPYGAPCFLTRLSCRGGVLKKPGLNAPYGAPYFLTIWDSQCSWISKPRLNAPYGAPCFLTWFRTNAEFDSFKTS